MSQCTKCVFPCQECTGVADYCRSCQGDYFLLGGKCIYKDYYYVNMTLKANSTFFLLKYANLTTGIVNSTTSPNNNTSIDSLDL